MTAPDFPSGEPSALDGPTASGQNMASIEDELREARRKIRRLERQLGQRRECPACRGFGVVDGFWLGTIKTCPACHGKGRQ